MDENQRDQIQVLWNFSLQKFSSHSKLATCNFCYYYILEDLGQWV